MAESWLLRFYPPRPLRPGGGGGGGGGRGGGADLKNKSRSLFEFLLVYLFWLQSSSPFPSSYLHHPSGRMDGGGYSSQDTNGLIRRNICEISKRWRFSWLMVDSWELVMKT
ncbi:unnamed protein product [Pleuronectes platessa]|uniref:Uncharacterized protein n=1 Tax=Pleuronectes platessa TaxID=8262 RepID=A0A9N7YS80_PLEPL|nr:unnamed protein product [Pleuronectes platessa]